MPYKRSTKYKVGVFVLLTAAILATTGALLGLFGTGKRPQRFYVVFEGSVVGLRKRASQVLYRGVPVGVVADISVNPMDPKYIAVAVDIEPTFRVTKGMEADIIITDLTGIRNVELRGGARGEMVVPPGGDIKGAPQIFEQIGEVAGGLVERSEQTLDSVNAVLAKENRERFANTLDSVAQIAKSLESQMNELLSGENLRHIGSTAANLDRLSTESLRLARKVGGGVEQVQSDVGRTLDSARQLIEDPAVSSAIKSASTMMTRLNELAGRLSKTLGEKELQGAVTDTRGLVRELTDLSREVGGLVGNLDGLISENRAEVRRVVTNLRLASDNLREVTLSLRSNPAALIRSAPAKPREVR